MNADAPMTPGPDDQAAQPEGAAHPTEKRSLLVNDTLPAFERTHLERLKLAADILLSEHDAITGPMEAELTLFRDRVEHALLLPGHPSREAVA
jgi:hypothetical protein